MCMARRSSLLGKETLSRTGPIFHEEFECGPLITRAASITSTTSIASSAANARAASPCDSLSREASLVRTLPGTLEEILVMGAQEAAISGGTKGR